MIIFSPNPGDGLFRVSAAGGNPSPVTTLDPTRNESTHRLPSFLPDGRHFLYWLRSGHPEKTGVYLGLLDSKEKKQVVAADQFGIYAPPGYLLFVNTGTLMAQAFNAETFQLDGEPFSVAEEILTTPYVAGLAMFSASETGLLAYRSGNLNNRITWFDRGGQQLGTTGSEALNSSMALSVDERKLAVSIGDSADIWVFELPNATRSRLTFGPSDDTNPI